MKTCQWFCLLLAIISIEKCLGEKREYEGGNLMDRNKMKFGNNFLTEIRANEAKDVKYGRNDDGYLNNYKKHFTTKNALSIGQQRELVIGKPDLSDPCFRVYNECIVINAQPYERRSNLQLEECKQRCMQSQNAIYNCHSLVYGVTNKICDFFAHQGDQLPSRLLKYYEHLYLEPTFANGCNLKYAKNMKSRKTDFTGGKVSNKMLLNDLTKENANKGSCEDGKVAKYLRTQGFQLDSANRIILKTYNLDACINACTNNIDDQGRRFKCRSFDYGDHGCSLFGEGVITKNTGQLKRNSDTNYYEKICVDGNLISNECQSINRFPQMILVGFAEAVVTTKSFMECFENCLKSRQLFGMNCTSGVYFYEELEQNCILNSENRQTQKNLFVEENADIVDYFEINCPLKKQTKIFDDSLFKS